MYNNQIKAVAWCKDMFGDQVTYNTRERALRFLEEAIELAQAAGLDQADVQGLADYVMSRPKGEPAQEVGGVMLTLYTLCAALDVDADQAFTCEMNRVWAPGFKAKLLKRQAEKLAAGVATCPGEDQ